MPRERLDRREQIAASARPGFHQLAIFVKVVEARSFAGAARLMGRSQPAISQAIARLEELYGGDLFERRRGAPLALTPIGEALLPSARTVLDTIDKQMTRAVAIAQGLAGNLTLGFFPGLAAEPLRAAIAGFTASCPNVRLRMVEALPGVLYCQLNERAIDLMIAALMPDFASKTLVQERLWEDPLIVALPAKHEFANKRALTWNDIAELSIMVRESHVELVTYRMLLDRVDRPVHLEQHDVSCATLLDMVGIGMGAAIVIGAVAEHKDVAFRRIDERNATVGVDAVWLKGDRNPLRHRLLSLIRQHKNDVGATSPSMAPGPDLG